MKIEHFPNEIKEIIYYYIPIEVKMNLTKDCFINNYIKKITIIPNYDSYIRYLIRNNHYFIFKLNFDINKFNWFNLKNWRYDRSKYKNYNEYLKHYSSKHNSKINELIKFNILR